MAATPAAAGHRALDRTETLLLAGLALAGVLAVFPLLVVAVPLWLAWRTATRGRVPRWGSLVGAALVVAAGGLWLLVTGRAPGGVLDEYLAAQLTAGRALLDLLVVPLARQQPIAAGELAGSALGYVRQVWPYGLIGGTAAALAWEAWRRRRAPADQRPDASGDRPPALVAAPDGRSPVVIPADGPPALATRVRRPPLERDLGQRRRSRRRLRWSGRRDR